MAIEDFIVLSDKFEPADTKLGFAFPCSACNHRKADQEDEPCNSCGHNPNASNIDYTKASENNNG